MKSLLIALLLLFALLGILLIAPISLPVVILVMLCAVALWGLGFFGKQS